jgi:hypothetical protein
MMMRLLATFVVACLLFGSDAGFGQEVPKRVSLVQLLANPKKFEGALVTVQGFLLMGRHRDLSVHALYLHREDADNLIDNFVLIALSDQMRHDEEQLDRMYVVVTGKFRVVQDVNKSDIATIKDIIDCKVWSDPSRPIGLKNEARTKYK